MRITPRKDEIAAVMEVLEDDSFDSPEAMAKAVIKEVGEVLWMRDWYALVHRFDEGSRGVNWGPFSTPGEATKIAAKMGTEGQWGAVKLYSPGMALARADGKKWPGFCQVDNCGHAPWLHTTDGSSRGRCEVATCACAKWAK